MVHTFAIESHPKAHVLYLDEEPLGSYPTVEAAEAAAHRVADQMQPGASLHFELDLRRRWRSTPVAALIVEQAAARRSPTAAPKGTSPCAGVGLKLSPCQ